MTLVAVELEDKVAIDLKETAQLLQTDEADVVQKALTNYLRQLKLDRIRAEIRPYAEAAGVFSEEDIYNEIS